MEIKEVVIDTTEVQQENETTNENSIISSATLDINEVNKCAIELEHLLYDNSDDNSCDDVKRNSDICNVHCIRHIPHINATELTRIANINRVFDQIKSWSLEETHLPFSTSSVIAQTKIPEFVVWCLCCERSAIVLSCLEILHHLVQHNSSFDKVKRSAWEIISELIKVNNDDDDVVIKENDSEKTLLDENNNTNTLQQIFVNGKCLIALLVKIMKAFSKKIEIQVDVMNVLCMVLSKEMSNEESAVLEDILQQQQQPLTVDGHVMEELVNLIVSIMYSWNDCAELQIAAVSLWTEISTSWPVFWELYSNSLFTLPAKVCTTTNTTSSSLISNKTTTTTAVVNVSIWQLLLDALTAHWNNLEIKRVCFHFLRKALQHDYSKFCVLHTTLPLKAESNTSFVEEEEWITTIHENDSEKKVWESIWDSCIRALPLSAYTLDVFRDVCEILGHLLPLATLPQVLELMKLLRMLLLKHGTTEVLTLTLGLLHAIFLKINYIVKSKETSNRNAQNLSETYNRPCIATIHGAYQLYPHPHQQQTREQNEEKNILCTQQMKTEFDNDNAEVQLCVKAIVDLCLPQLIMHVVEYHQHALAVQHMVKNDEIIKNNDDDERIPNDVQLELLCVVAQNCLKALPL